MTVYVASIFSLAGSAVQWSGRLTARRRPETPERRN